MAFFRALFVGSVLLLMSACDSSTNTNNNPNATDAEVLTGQFIDSLVAGLRYATDTRSGVTNSDGQFQYLEGEAVLFYVGDLMLGEARGAAVVSVFDLVDGVTPVVGNALRMAVAEDGGGPGFRTVINTATLLQTLDSDGNPDNGIQIPADVAALFTADSVDFNQNWREFAYDQGLLKALAAAKERSLLGGDRQARKPWLVMSHLYASLGIESELLVASSESRDSDGDGTPDSSITYAFDAQGKPVRRVSDFDNDGAPDETVVYTYDAAGNLARDAQAYGGREKPDYIAMYHYDAQGNQVGRMRDLDGDGTIDEVATYSYDAKGNRTGEQSGANAGSAPKRVSTDTYDATGNHTRSEQDRDGDGKADQINTFAYDDNGNRTRSEQDNGADGKPDLISTSVSDAAGNVIRQENDQDADGTPDQIFTYAYDANAKLIREEADLNDDGTPDATKTFVYDDYGHLEREELDANGDGTPDAIIIISTTYDAAIDGWWSAFNDAMDS